MSPSPSAPSRAIAFATLTDSRLALSVEQEALVVLGRAALGDVVELEDGADHAAITPDRGCRVAPRGAHREAPPRSVPR